MSFSLEDPTGKCHEQKGGKGKARNCQSQIQAVSLLQNFRHDKELHVHWLPQCHCSDNTVGY
jgi:hypothetical protein